MESLTGIIYGFSLALQPTNLLFCFMGCLIGTLIGVLPGIGPGGTIALLLPITYYVPPSTAIIMLAGVYFGAMYGGSTTSILVNIPGEAASAITCLDGYQMARIGRAGPALGMAAIGSFIAGTFGIIGLMAVAPPLAKFAMKFGSPEYVAIIILGLTLLSYLGSGSKLKAFIIAAFGLLLGTIGSDPVDGINRFTFGIVYLMDGVGLIPVLMGVFGISEILSNLEEEEFHGILKEKIKNLYPNLKDWMDSKWPILRGTVIGFCVGTLPGGSATIASMISYATEKRISKHPEKFGTGTIEGVAGPESANNSAVSGGFIPLLSLGIPTNQVTAVLLAALMIHGVMPGPLLIQRNPDLFWSVIASMYIGNLMLLALNLPLVGIWVQVLKVPYYYLFPLIFIFCLIGSYGTNNSIFDVGVMIFFGIIGYYMRKFGYEPAPLILAFILGPMFEDNFRRSLTISSGSFWIFFTRPIAATLIIIALFLFVTPLFVKLAKRWRSGSVVPI